MDSLNLHLVIPSVLLAFGSAHAAGKSKAGFWAFLLLAVPMYLQLFSGMLLNIVAVSVVLGFVYAKSSGLQNLLYGIVDAGRALLSDVGSLFSGMFSWIGKLKPTGRKTGSHNQNYQHTDQQQRAWQEEQARREREQEAKARRQQSKKQQKQQSRQSHNRQQEQQRQQQEQRQRQQQEQAYQRQQEQERQRQREWEQQEQARRQREQEDAKRRQERAMREAEEKDTRSPLEILNLQAGFTQQELKAAYKRASAQCHPDKWANKPAAIRKAMEEEQKRINWAYQQLK
ncbi:MAG: J domain-containing protein [bacterium]